MLKLFEKISNFPKIIGNGWSKQWIKCAECIPTKLCRVIESPVLVQSLNCFHISLIQVEIGDLRVFLHSLNLYTLRNHSQSLLNHPSKDNLMRWFSMFFRNFNDSLVFIAWFFIFLGKSDFEIWACTKTWITCHLNTFLPCISDEIFLIQLRMDLILKNFRL